jgi:hypothetical protein
LAAGTFSVISSQIEFWSLDDIQVLFGPMPDRQLRQILHDHAIHAAGVRPACGRGRPPLVYPAADVCDVLGGL